MRRRRRTAGMLLTVLVCGASVGAPAATRASAPPAGERQAARAYADAALHFSRHAQLRAKEAWRLMGVVDPGRCIRTLTRLERRRGVARADRERAELLAMLAVQLPLMRALQPAMARFAAALEAVPTRDPALRSGRASWRQQAVTSGLIWGALPEDVCTRLRAWEVAGAKSEPVPEVEVDLHGGTLAEGIVIADEPEEQEAVATDGKIERAAERLRELGQGPRRSARFTGEAAIRPYVGVMMGLFGVMLTELGDDALA